MKWLLALLCVAVTVADVGAQGRRSRSSGACAGGSCASGACASAPAFYYVQATQQTAQPAGCACTVTGECTCPNCGCAVNVTGVPRGDACASPGAASSGAILYYQDAPRQARRGLFRGRCR